MRVFCRRSCIRACTPACCCVQPAFYWEWYCSGKEVSSTLQSFMRAFIMGWLPSLLLNLWLGMVLPRLVYLVVQVGWATRQVLLGWCLLRDRCVKSD